MTAAGREGETNNEGRSPRRSARLTAWLGIAQAILLYGLGLASLVDPRPYRRQMRSSSSSTRRTTADSSSSWAST